MADTEIYRSRWIDCEDCESVTIIERRDERGVPDESEWEEFPRCLVCSGSLRHWNADEKTQDDIYWAKGRRAGLAEAARESESAPTTSPTPAEVSL